MSWQHSDQVGKGRCPYELSVTALLARILGIHPEAAEGIFSDKLELFENSQLANTSYITSAAEFKKQRVFDYEYFVNMCFVTLG